MTDLSPVPIPAGLPAAEKAGDFRLSVANPRHILSIACGAQSQTQLGQWLEAEYALSLPGSGRLNTKVGVTILSSAQNQWFLELPGDLAQDSSSGPKRALTGIASVTDQTGGWVRFEIAGPNLANVLCRLCPIDVEQMGQDAVVRTRIHHIGCFIWRDGSGMVVLGPRSMAASLWHAIVDTAKSASLQLA